MTTSSLLDEIIDWFCFDSFRNDKNDENASPNNNGSFGGKYSLFDLYSCKMKFSFQLTAVDVVDSTGVAGDLDRVTIAILVVSVIHLF